MPRRSRYDPADAVDAAVQRALKLRFETMKVRAQMVERRIEREHATALRRIANDSSSNP